MRAVPPSPGIARNLVCGGSGTPGCQRRPWSLTNSAVRGIQYSAWFGANATATPATLRAADSAATLRATDPSAVLRATDPTATLRATA
jgi:hypothetical protein